MLLSGYTEQINHSIGTNSEQHKLFIVMIKYKKQTQV